MCFKRNTNRKIILGGKKKTMVYNAKRSILWRFKTRDGNGASFFRYPSRPAPNGTGSILINGFRTSLGIFLKPGAGSGIGPPHPDYI